MKTLLAASLVFLLLQSTTRAEVIFDLQHATNSRLHMEVNGTVQPASFDLPWQFTFDEPTDRLTMKFTNPLGATFATETIRIIGESDLTVQTDLFVRFTAGNANTADGGRLQDQSFFAGLDITNIGFGNHWQTLTLLQLSIVATHSETNPITISNIIVRGSVVPEPGTISLGVMGALFTAGSFRAARRASNRTS